MLSLLFPFPFAPGGWYGKTRSVELSSSLEASGAVLVFFLARSAVSAGGTTTAKSFLCTVGFFRGDEREPDGAGGAGSSEARLRLVFFFRGAPCEGAVFSSAAAFDLWCLLRGSLSSFESTFEPHIKLIWLTACWEASEALSPLAGLD